MSSILVYTIFPNAGEARAIAAKAIESKLAACANIFAPHESLYFWDGAVQNDQETAMILKTIPEKFEDLKTLIVTAHSYECPCIVALPVTDGHKPFLDWVEQNVT